MPPRSQATWNSACDVILIKTLFKQRDNSKATSNGNWHADAWTAAATALSGMELHSWGTAKMSGSCQNQWGAVSTELLFIAITSHTD